MAPRSAKKMAADAGLELYYSTEWQSWGLIDPACDVEGLWLSPSHLRALSREEFKDHYIDVMVERITENVA